MRLRGCGHAPGNGHPMGCGHPGGCGHPPRASRPPHVLRASHAAAWQRPRPGLCGHPICWGDPAAATGCGLPMRCGQLTGCVARQRADASSAAAQCHGVRPIVRDMRGGQAGDPRPKRRNDRRRTMMAHLPSLLASPSEPFDGCRVHINPGVVRVRHWRTIRWLSSEHPTWRRMPDLQAETAGSISIDT